MTVYTQDLGPNPFGSFGGGMRNPRMPTPRPRPMNRPPMNQYQMPPMNQMPRRMPGGPSKGGTTSIQAPPSRGGAPWGGYNPNAGFPGGPGKARNRGQSRGGSWFGGGMPGGPGKGRLQDPFRRQTMQPQPFFGNTTAPQPFFGNPTSPQPDLTGSGEGGYGEIVGDLRPGGSLQENSGGLGGMIGGDSDWSPMVSSADIGINGRPSVDNQGKFINNQTGEIRYGQPSQPMPYQPDMSHNTNRGGTSWGSQGGVPQPNWSGLPMPQPQGQWQPFQPAVDLSSKQRGGPRFGINMPNPPGFNQMPNVPPQPDNVSGYMDFYNHRNFIGNNPPPPEQVTTGELPSLLQGPLRQESMTGDRGSFGQLGPTNPMEYPQQPSDFGVQPFYRDHRNVPQQRGGVPQQPIMRNAASRFYGGGIMDLYPR